jgi:hypothetical protein
MRDIVSLVYEFLDSKSEQRMRMRLPSNSREDIWHTPVLVVPDETVGLRSLHPDEHSPWHNVSGNAWLPKPTILTNEI